MLELSEVSDSDTEMLDRLESAMSEGAVLSV